MGCRRAGGRPDTGSSRAGSIVVPARGGRWSRDTRRRDARLLGSGAAHPRGLDHHADTVTAGGSADHGHDLVGVTDVDLRPLRPRLDGYKVLAVVVVLAILCVALRIALLTSQSLWIDEGISVDLSTSSSLMGVLSNLAGSSASDRYQPLYNLIQYAWRLPFGSGEESLRALSVVLGSSAVFITTAAVWATYGRRRAVWTLVLGALSSCAVYYSQEVRAYSLILVVAALELASLMWLLRADGRWRRRAAALLFCVSVAVGLAASLLMILFAGALAAAHVATRRSVRAVAPVWIAAAVSTLPVLAYYGITSLGQGGRPAAVSLTPIVWNALFVPYGLIFGTTLGPSINDLRGSSALLGAWANWPTIVAALAIASALAVSVLWSLRKQRDGAQAESDRMLAVVLLAGFAASLGLAAATQMIWLPRHSIFLLVPLWALLPISAPRFVSLTDRHNIRAIPLVALVCLNGVSLQHYFFDPRFARDDYRAAAQYLAAADGAGSASVLLTGEPSLLAYYGDSGTIDGRSVPHDRIAPYLISSWRGHRSVLVALNRDYMWDPAGIQPVDAAMASCGFSVTAETTFTNFVIHTYAPVPSSGATTSQSCQ